MIRTFLIIGFTVSSLLYLCGCGATKSSNLQNGSRGSDSVPGEYGPLAECLRVNVTSPRMTGVISTYYDFNQISYDYANLMLTLVPAEIFTNTSYHIQFFRWSATSSGQKQVNQVPVRIYFASRSLGNRTAVSVDRINRTIIEQARTELGTSVNSVGINQFFERAMVVLSGLDYQYDAVTAALYNTSSSTTAIGQGDILLPPVYANPRTYMAIKPIPLVYNLHPFYSYVNSGASDSDYLRMSEELCQQIGGGDRTPASLSPRKPSYGGSIFFNIWNRLVEALILFKGAIGI